MPRKSAFSLPRRLDRFRAGGVVLPEQGADRQPHGFVRAENPYMRVQTGAYVRWAPLPGNGELYRAWREQVFAGPVAVLTGAQTFSDT